MRAPHALTLAGLTLVLAAQPARADQPPVALHLAKTLFAAAPAPDSVRIEAVLTKADNHTAAGRMGEARRLYRGLIEEQRESRQYAGAALWRLATNLVYDGDVQGGATMLDELAGEAARYGDPTMELRATFEAAVLWQKARRQDLVRKNLDRVQCLLQSPAIAADVKTTIQRRIVS